MINHSLPPPSMAFCRKCESEHQIRNPKPVLSEKGYYKTVIGACSNCGDQLEADALSPQINHLRCEGWRKVHKAEAEGVFSTPFPITYIDGIEELRKSVELIEVTFEDKPDWDGEISSRWFELGCIVEPIANLKQDIRMTRSAGELFEKAGATATKSLKQIYAYEKEQKYLIRKYRKAWKHKVLPLEEDVAKEDYAPLSDLFVNYKKVRGHLEMILLAFSRAERCFQRIGDATRAEASYINKMDAEKALAKRVKSLWLVAWRVTSKYGTSFWRWVVILFAVWVSYSFLYLHTPSWLPSWFGILEFEGKDVGSIGTTVLTSFQTLFGVSEGNMRATTLLSSIIMTSEVILGYILLAILVSLLYRKLFR